MEFSTSIYDFRITRALLNCLLEHMGELFLVVGTEHHVDVLELLEQLLSIALPDASAYSDIAFRITATLSQWQVFHGFDLAHESLVGLLANAAGHEYAEIGFFIGGNGDCAELFEHSRNLF